MDSPEVRRMASDWTDGLRGGKPGDASVCSVSLLGSGGRTGGEGCPFSFSVLVLLGKPGGTFLVGRVGITGVFSCEWPLRAGEAAVWP